MDHIVLYLSMSFKLKSEEGIQDTKVTKAWQKDLAKRTEKARAAGRHLPVKLYQALYRPTEVSLQFIRWYGLASCAQPATGKP